MDLVEEHKFEAELQMHCRSVSQHNTLYAFKVTRALCHHYLSIEAFLNDVREQQSVRHLRWHQMFVFGRVHLKMHYYF